MAENCSREKIFSFIVDYFFRINFNNLFTKDVKSVSFKFHKMNGRRLNYNHQFKTAFNGLLFSPKIEHTLNALDYSSSNENYTIQLTRHPVKSFYLCYKCFLMMMMKYFLNFPQK